MIPFRKITVSDRDWIVPTLQQSNFRLAEYTFGNYFLWSESYHVSFAPFEGFCLSRGGTEFHAYSFPAGNGDLKKAIDALIADAAEHGEPFRMRAISKENKEKLEAIYPQKFHFEPYRDSFDYLYNAQDLITLAGKKYQSKRNHASRFKKTYQWIYEDITPENIAECAAMNEEWCRQYGCNENDSLQKETCAVKRALQYFFELQLTGGLLRVDGKVVAYTVGERLNSDTFIVHIEKAFSEFHGVYQAMNQLFAEKHAAGFRYINREDDAGDEGLRKAKLSYQPVELIEKYIATIVDAGF